MHWIRYKPLEYQRQDYQQKFLKCIPPGRGRRGRTRIICMDDIRRRMREKGLTCLYWEDVEKLREKQKCKILWIHETVLLHCIPVYK